MYIAIAVVIAAIMGGGATHYIGIESLFITAPVAILLGIAAGFLQPRD